MEPLQRIPRYHLFLKRALRDMEDDDPARFDVEQAMTVAEQIANLDEDEETRRAAALWGLYRSIDGFPVSRTLEKGLASAMTRRWLTSHLRPGHAHQQSPVLCRLHRCPGHTAAACNGRVSSWERVPIPHPRPLLHAVPLQRQDRYCQERVN